MVEPASSVRPQFGGRLLKEGEDVFQHNAWDNVEWGEEQEQEARAAVERSSGSLVAGELAEEYEQKAGEFWDKFYSVHQNRFFKERNWLFTEFPDLAPGLQAGRERVFTSTRTGKAGGGVNSSDVAESGVVANSDIVVNSDVVVDNDVVVDSDVVVDRDGPSLSEAVSTLREDETYFGANSSFRMLEIGCGTGSSVFPILEVNCRSDLVVYCCDLSQQAVGLVKEHKDYASGRCFSWVSDVTQDDWAAPFPPESLDVVTLIFVLSAISPEKMEQVVARIFLYLKPGGQVMFRDYGRYDLAQLRFKPGRCISDNFYARGDGTRCYFFSQAELRQLFCGAGFVERQNLADRRLQVNRGKKLKMYRVWIQAKYQKPEET